MLSVSRRFLTMAIAVRYEGFDSVTYPDWESLFRAFNYRCAKGSTLCLDEFPYLVKSCEMLPSTKNRHCMGEMVDGSENQSDNDKIERYCYDNDTTNCDRYGGLYQWAEMMGFNDSCNTKSCAHLIDENFYRR